MSTLINWLNALAVRFSPTGGISATNVQDAIAELDAETVKTTGNQNIGGVKSFLDTTTLSQVFFNMPIPQFPAGALEVTSNGTNRLAIIARSITGQTSDVFQTRNNANVITLGIDPTGVLKVNSTEAATNTTTGSARFAGGIGVAGSGWFGGEVRASGLVSSVEFVSNLYRGSNVAGTNIPAANYVIRPGLSTGNATPASILFSTSDTGISGASAQASSEKMRLSGLGNLLIGTTTDNTVDKLQVNGSVITSQYKLSALNTTPSSATDTGTLGEIRIDANHIYVCTAVNTWKRSALTTW
jgi:hypothetical protein